MRDGSLATQLNKSDIACKLQDWSAGLYDGAERLSSLVNSWQDIPALETANESVLEIQLEINTPFPRVDFVLRYHSNRH